MPRKGTKRTPEQRAAHAEYGRAYYAVMKNVPGYLDKKRASGRAAARKLYARVMADPAAAEAHRAKKRAQYQARVMSNPAAADAYRAKKRAEYRARVLRQTALA